MAITTDQIKLQRQRLNKAEIGIKKTLPNSRETSLSLTALQESIMFLGLVLKDIDAPNPYPESHDKTSQKIEPRADVSEQEFNFDATDDIGMIKEMRQFVDEQIVNMKNMYLSAFDTPCPPENQPFFATHLITAITNAERAKMWLGMLLGSIREQKENDEKHSIKPKP